MSTPQTEILQPSLIEGAACRYWPHSLRVRQLTPEIMDDPTLMIDAHQQALAGLARTNCWGSTRRQIWRSLHDIARKRNLNRLRILDVACGAGDLAIWLAQRARRQGLDWQIEGCDKSTTALDFATHRSTAAGITSVRFRHLDISHQLPDSTYDIIVSTLFLHHLAEKDAIQFLMSISHAARHAVLIDDLRRSFFGYALARIGSILLTRSPVVRVDAPLSVQAAFTDSEALALFESAALYGASLSRHWPERYLISWEKP